jgi:hypothetical protein
VRIVLFLLLARLKSLGIMQLSRSISLVTNADVYLTHEYTVLYMPLGQPPRTAAPLPMSFRLRPRKLPAEALQAIVGM